MNRVLIVAVAMTLFGCAVGTEDNEPVDTPNPPLDRRTLTNNDTRNITSLELTLPARVGTSQFVNNGTPPIVGPRQPLPAPVGPQTDDP